MEKKVSLVYIAKEITLCLPDEIKARYQVSIINNKLFLKQVGTKAAYVIKYNFDNKELHFEIKLDNLTISNVAALNNEKILSVNSNNIDRNFNLMFNPDYSIIKLVNENQHSRIYFEYERYKNQLDMGIYNFRNRNSYQEFYPEVGYLFRNNNFESFVSHLKFRIASDHINYSGEIKHGNDVNSACISNDNLLSDAPYDLSLMKIANRMNSLKYFGYPLVGAVMFKNEEVSELLNYICDNIIPTSIDNTLINLLLSRMLSHSYQRNLPYQEQIMTIIKRMVNPTGNITTNFATYDKISEIIKEHIESYPMLKFNSGAQIEGSKEKSIGVHPELK